MSEFENNQPVQQVPPTDQSQAQVPPVYYPQLVPAPVTNKMVSKSTLAWMLLFSVLLSACFTLGSMYALGIAQIQGDGNKTSQSANVIKMDGVTITLDEGANEQVKENLKKLGQAIKAYKDNFYRELSTSELLEALVSGMPSNLGNPYSYYLSSEEYATMQQEHSGQYSGIGARISQTPKGAFEIVDVTPNSPAEESGVLIGDYILAVGHVKAETYKDTTSLAGDVKGAEGSTVTLTLFRPSENREIVLDIKRRTVKSIYISHKMLENKNGYIAISEFSSNMPEQFEEALTDLVNQGAKNLIFDLRNNPGGDANAVQEILDMLLPEGVVASVKGRSNGKTFEEKWYSHEGQLVPEDMKFAILVNKNSASASELFSGAMRDRLGTPIIGEQTFGKGSGTRFYTLEDGSAVNVTSFLYYFPGGDTPEGEGISPTIEVSLPDEVLTKSISSLTLEEDTQLSEAIKALE